MQLFLQPIKSFYALLVFWVVKLTSLPFKNFKDTQNYYLVLQSSHVCCSSVYQCSHLSILFLRSFSDTTWKVRSMFQHILNSLFHFNTHSSFLYQCSSFSLNVWYRNEESVLKWKSEFRMLKDWTNSIDTERESVLIQRGSVCWSERILCSI